MRINISKRLVSALLALCLAVSLTACSNLPAAADYAQTLLQPYRAFIRITDGTTEYTGTVTLSADGVLDFVFAEPTLLCGIGYRFTGSESCIVYNDINIPLETDTVITGTGVCTWRDMLTPDGEYSVQRVTQDGVNRIILSDGETDYYFNEADKTPLMTVRGDITIIFTEFEGAAAETGTVAEDLTNEAIPEGTGGN